MWSASQPSDIDSCWIDLQGKFYAVVAGEHRRFASCFAKSIEGLESEGWMHFSGGSLINDYLHFSNSQIDTVYDWIEILEKSPYISNREIVSYIRNALELIFDN